MNIYYKSQTKIKQIKIKSIIKKSLLTSVARERPFSGLNCLKMARFKFDVYFYRHLVLQGFGLIEMQQIIKKAFLIENDVNNMSEG